LSSFKVVFGEVFVLLAAARFLLPTMVCRTFSFPLSSLLAGANTVTITATDRPYNRSYVILYTPGQIWENGKPFWEQQWDGHKEYWLDLSKTGETCKVQAGGPFTNHTGGMVIVDVKEEEDLQNLVDNDPAVKNKLLQATVYPWKPVASTF
jgi:uncharacterized protein YciI